MYIAHKGSVHVLTFIKGLIVHVTEAVTAVRTAGWVNINPRRACAERVTVVVSCVYVSVCLSICPHTRYSGSTRD